MLKIGVDAMFNEDIERKLFENWCYKNCWNINKCPKDWEHGDEYCDQFVAGAWEGWKAAKRNIIPMNVEK